MIGTGIGILKRPQIAPQNARDYRTRVAAGSGSIINDGDMVRLYKFYLAQGTLANTRVLFDANAGMVQRLDGVLRYVRTAFDLSSNANNLNGSATATVQPRLVGGIAPQSKYAASNQNGEARYFTHTPVSFAAGEAWSACVVINTSFDPVAISVFGKSGTGRFGFLSSGTTSNYVFQNESGVVSTGVNGKALKYIGKGTVCNLVATGDGTLKIYANGVLDDTLTVVTNFVFERFLYGRFSGYNGRGNFYRLQSGAMTPAQVSAEAAMLATRYPEMESVVIGSKTVASRNFEAVASANGTVVPQLTTSAAWSAGTSGWCYHNGATPDTSNPDSGAKYGKLYNKAARDVIKANPPAGWHVATEAELTTLAALGGNALKYAGTNYWTTAGGTNTSGFTALGGSYRNAAGTFGTVNESACFWCADSDKVLKVYHNNDTAEVVAVASVNDGYSIRLIKD